METVEQIGTEIKVFEPYENQLATLKEYNEKMVFDYESKDGNKLARSHIAGLRSTKGALEAARKKAKQASIDYGRALDKKAGEIEAALNAMIDVHYQPLLAIEQREKDRISAIQARIDQVKTCESIDFDFVDAAYISMKIDFVSNLDLSTGIDEFLDAALDQRESTLKLLKSKYEAKLKQEQEQEELERLRAEKAKKDQEEREKKIRKDAAEQATREAEEKAKAVREQAEKRELELQQQAEQATRDVEAAKAKAEKEKQEAIDRERASVAEEKQRLAKEEQDRASQKEHVDKVNAGAIISLMGYAGCKQESAERVVSAIAKGEILNVKITY